FLGRGEACEIRLPSAFVSERHLVIEDQDGAFTIERFGDNPSHLNSTELPLGERKPLNSSDTVFVQGFLIQVAHDEKAAATDVRREREAFNSQLRSLHESIIQRRDPQLHSADDVRTPLGRKSVQEVVVSELSRMRINELSRRFGAREALRDSVLTA